MLWLEDAIITFKGHILKITSLFVVEVRHSYLWPNATRFTIYYNPTKPETNGYYTYVFFIYNRFILRKLAMRERT